jgi:hypothetical protein
MAVRVDPIILVKRRLGIGRPIVSQQELNGLYAAVRE